MKNNEYTPSLTENESRGGETAERGFSFQADVILSLIPKWLAQDSFCAMTRESIGDTEAKFFMPGHGYRREFVEVKNHTLTPAEFWEEIKRFKQVDTGSPETYYKFTLAATGLPPTIKPLINMLERVRKSYDFYEDGSGVKDNSFNAYLEKVKEIKHTEEEARFIFKQVFILADLSTAQSNGEALFRQSLIRHLPEYEELPAKFLGNIYNNLYTFVKNKINEPITRLELEKMLEKDIDPKYLPNTHSVAVHTANEDKTANKDKDNTQGIFLDWKIFFGGNNRIYPPAEKWNKKMITELKETKEFIMQNHKTRRIKLTGSRRLSASLAIGSIFSAVSGFTIDMEYRSETWSTDAHSTSQTPHYLLDQTNVDTCGEHIVVSIGIIREIRSEVETSLKQLGLDGLPILHLEGKEAIKSPEHTNSAVRSCKEAIDKALAYSQAKLIHLFIASPAHFALFFGHRINATANVQCYEWVSTGHYVPTCLLSS